MKLYVGQLAWNTDENTLKAHFEQCGTVTEVTISKDRDTGRSRGMGFVTMTTAEEGLKAITDLNGKDLDGKDLIINEAPDRRRR